MTFSFTDILLFIGISQGVFLATTLRLVHKRNEPANRVLSFTIVLAVIMLIGRVVAIRYQSYGITKAAILVDTTILLFGPLLYTYVRRLAFNEQPHFKLSILHYSLGGFHLIYALVLSIIPLEYFESYLQGVKVQYIGWLIETLGLLSLLFYTGKCIALIYTHRKTTQKELSYDLQVNRYLVRLVVAMSISALLWLMSFVCGYFFRISIPYVNYTTLWISIPSFIYVVGYFSLRQPEIFRVPFVPSISVERPRLKPEQITILQKRLNHYIKIEQVYEQPDLTLKSLASLIDTSPNNLSWLLNQVYQNTFYDYINRLRVEAVINKIEENMHKKHTLLAIAFDSGFNAKSTFNKAFKNHTGFTPSQFIKEKNVA